MVVRYGNGRAPRPIKFVGGGKPMLYLLSSESGTSARTSTAVSNCGRSFNNLCV
jgi:hypothetical protein